MSRRHAREVAAVDQRESCDCMRAAVATYLGMPYELMPAISGRRDATTFWSDWTEWLGRRELAIATFGCAPGHLRRWIAIVGRTRPGPLHAVVMARTKLLHDPALPPERLVRVERDEVFCAIVIGPAGDPGWARRISDAMSDSLAAGDAHVWPLERLMDAPWNVELLRLRGQAAEADAMDERLARVTHRWPDAAIADGEAA